MDKEIIIALCTLVGAFFGSKPLINLISRAFDHYKSKNQVKNYIKMMDHLRALQNKMREIRDRTQAERVIIFSGHNSGGLPRPSSRYYTTAVHWEVEEEKEFYMTDYKNIPVDPLYLEMLIKSYRDDFYRFKVDVEPASQLKRIYEAEEITDSIVFYLDLHENNFIYLSASTKDEGGFEDHEVTRIELLAYNIRDLVRNANKDDKMN